MSEPDNDYEYSDDECDELMDWVADVYGEQGNASPTVDLTQYEVVVTNHGVYPTDSSRRGDL